MNPKEMEAAINLLTRRVNNLEATKVIARYNTAAAQAIPFGAFTIVNFETRVYDTRKAVRTGPTWKFVAPATDYYMVDASIMFASEDDWDIGVPGGIHLYKNGVEYSNLCRKDNYPGGAVAIYMQLGGSDIVYLVEGDKIDIRVWQETTHPIPEPGTLSLFGNRNWNYVSIRSIK